ncbi:MAG: MarR family transcriptional regulator [Acidimicrobiaceae bacterium]|nr:MarR family transcriptional regulator [Acidimicrobiaceae bacterium]MBO0746898.1 MarR family transcriptional regulator [Acidimicrobiaceae bacterium]
MSALRGGSAEGRGPGKHGEGPSFEEDGYESLRQGFGRMLAAERRLRGREGRPGGISSSHLRALFILLHEPEATPGTLAKAADLNPASVTAMIDQLEAQGLVERRRDTHDRRSIQISLTPAGRAKVEEKERYWRSRFDEFFSDLTAEELAAAAKVLDRAAAMMTSMMEDSSEVRPG